MRVKANTALLAVAVILLACGNARAVFDEWAIAAKAGTLGLGGDVTTNLIPQVNLRAGVQWLGFDFDAEFDDVDYNVDVDFLNPLVLIDWHPFNGSFRVSGGVLFGDNDIRLRARPNESLEIGDQTFSPTEIGTLRGDVEIRSVAPYVGIGWGNALDAAGRWGLVTDFGVAFTGAPDVDLSATGTLAGDPTFQAELAEEEDEIQDDLDAFKIYPVLSISLFYRF